MKLCCSLAPSTTAEALEKIKAAAKYSDVIELRIDAIADADLKLLLRSPRPPMIITHRTAEEGGKFSGSRSEHLSVLHEAIALGADYVDIEYSTGLKHIQNLIEEARNTKVIVSYHNFQETPRSLPAMYKKMKASGAPIIKIAAMANTVTDNLRMVELLQLARSERQALIALCMGERGQLSRILQGKFGGYLMYAPLTKEEATAPGQFCIEDLINIFRVPILRKQTKVFGLIGNPVSHSKGIYFHNRIFSRKKLDAVYVNFLVDTLPEFIEQYRTFVSAFSVTMPYKQAILPLLDATEEGISELQAVNTVVNRRGKLTGMNIDLLAIIACLKKRTSLNKKNVTVLGTGGTARTMAYAALQGNAAVTIVGRNAGKAKSLAASLGCRWISQEHLSEISTDILLNATSVGMNSTTAIPFSVDRYLHNKMIVFDAVYTPPDTALLRAAEQAGCKTISGLELFRTQAKLQSKIFLSLI